MNDFSQQQFSAFFLAISAWRAAYRRARLHFLAVRQNEELSIISARIYLDVGGSDQVKAHFHAGPLEVGQWDIPQTELSVEDATLALIGEHGLLSMMPPLRRYELQLASHRKPIRLRAYTRPAQRGRH